MCKFLKYFLKFGQVIFYFLLKVALLIIYVNMLPTPPAVCAYSFQQKAK